MLSKNVIDNILDEASLRGADFAEVFDENTLLQETEGNPDGIGQSQVGRDSGVGIRIFKNENCYYGYTNDRSEKALKERDAKFIRVSQALFGKQNKGD